jgi:hypothetical protein
LRTAAGAPFAGAASGWAETLDADGDSHLALHGLPPGLILSKLDYVGFRWDAAGDAAGTWRRRALVRVVVGGVVDAGGTVTPVCEPPVPAAVPPGATAHLDRPCCVMKLVADQTKLAAIDRRLAVTGGTIVGLQDLRA